MIHFSTFSGIGGFDLASEWMGWKNYISCEINPFGNKVLEYYWPEAYHHGDIHTLTYELINEQLIQRFGADWRSYPVILTGGFPCQPFSLAGERKGTEDSRHLWPEMLRLIREVRPKYIVGENVGGIISWDGGMVFEQVQIDLESEGYEVQPFILPACAVNAPHRRDRVWFVANSNCIGQSRQEHRETKSGWTTETCVPNDWQNFPTQSFVCSRNDGIPNGLAGITVSKHRNESIKAYGNAIVPQVAYQIFKAIKDIEDKIL
jgi:DNA (cytosine-5)-methyltransferase 1